MAIIRRRRSRGSRVFEGLGRGLENFGQIMLQREMQQQKTSAAQAQESERRRVAALEQAMALARDPSLTPEQKQSLMQLATSSLGVELPGVDFSSFDVPRDVRMAPVFQGLAEAKHVEDIRSPDEILRQALGAGAPPVTGQVGEQIVQPDVLAALRIAEARRAQLGHRPGTPMAEAAEMEANAQKLRQAAEIALETRPGIVTAETEAKERAEEPFRIAASKRALQNVLAGRQPPSAPAAPSLTQIDLGDRKILVDPKTGREVVSFQAGGRPGKGGGLLTGGLPMRSGTGAQAVQRGAAPAAKTMTESQVRAEAQKNGVPLPVARKRLQNAGYTIVP